MSAIKTSAAQNHTAPVKSKKLTKLLASTTLAAASLMALGTTAHADNWTDHTVLDGSTSVDLSIPNTTNITQNTSFVKAQGSGDINAGWTVNVAQPSNDAKYVLYDVTGDATQLMGALNANGEIYIFNQQGIIFGANSAVNVGSIITSTGNISDANIKAGNLVFENVDTGASIVLNGSVTVAEAGLAAFVAPQVINNGIITAKLGKVAMASGSKVTLDLYGDNLIEIAVDDKSADGLIKNSGVINAEGGVVAMSVQTAKAAVDDVINMGGVVSASSATVQGGKIILSGGKSGVVKVAGKLDASGENGGTVKVTGENIHVTEEAEVYADGGVFGHGGDVRYIAQNGLVYSGRTYARGGLASGNGGFVDTSGLGWVDIDGNVNASAFNGAAGSWLIDPRDLQIISGSGSSSGITGSNPFSPSNSGTGASQLRASVVQAALNLGTDVLITTVGSPSVSGGGDGTISILASIYKFSGDAATLTMNAAGSIVMAAGTTIKSFSDTLGVNFTAAKDITVNGDIDTNGGAVNFTANDNITLAGAITTGAGAVNFTAGDDITIGGNGSVGNAGDVGSNGSAGGNADAGTAGTPEYWQKNSSPFNIVYGNPHSSNFTYHPAVAGVSGSNGANGSNGSAGAAGTNGSNGGNGTITTTTGNIVLNADSITLGGNGGLGGAGGNGGNGGLGGNAVNGYTGGNGGAGGAGGQGGAGGNGGTGSLASGTGTISLVADDIAFSGASGSSAGQGGDGGSGGKGGKSSNNESGNNGSSGANNSGAIGGNGGNGGAGGDNGTDGGAGGKGGKGGNGGAVGGSGNGSITTSSTVTIARKTEGDVSVGDNNGGLVLDQSELNKITAAALVIGRQGATSGDDTIYVDNADLTRFNLVTLNTRTNSSDNGTSSLKQDVMFDGLTQFKGLIVNAEDDIIVDDDARISVTTASSFNAGLAGSVGDFFMDDDSTLDGNGANLNINSRDAKLDDGADIESEGGNVTIATRNVTLDDGADIDALGGNILISNTGTFNSDDTDSLHTRGVGTITLSQDDNGNIQNAINAVDNSGTGLNTINVGAGTYNENVRIYENNFALLGAKAGVSGNDASRSLSGAVESKIVDGSGSDGNAYGLKVTSNNVRIDGFSVNVDGAGVLLDGGAGGKSGFLIENNIIKTINVNDGLDVGIQGKKASNVIVEDNNLVTIGNDGMDFNGGSNVTIRNNTVNATTGGSYDGIRLSGINTADVVDNIVHNTGDDGIVVNNGTGTTTVSGNTVYNVDKGILATNTAGLTINNNTVYNIDENAIHVVDSASAQITNNLVGTLGFVNGTGIFVDPSPFTSIAGNTVNGGLIGIHVLDSDDVTVGGFGEGEENTITGSGTGVLVENSDNADVLHNAIYGAGTGVHVLNSAYVDVLGNTVQGYGYGTGVLVENGDNARIGDGWSSEDSDRNTISSVDTGIAVRGVWNGDYIDRSDYVTIDNNEVYSVNNGIHAADTYGLNIEDNDLSGGHCGWGNGTGVYVGNSENVRIGGRRDGNDVDSFWNGITVSDSNDVRIRRNDVWNISNDGIQVFGGNYVLIARNDVWNISNDGIYVGDMTVWNDDEESEELAPNVIIRKNNIDWTDGDGIEVGNVNFSLIEQNNVGLDGGYDEASIGGNGITVVGYSEDDPTIIRNNLVANVEDNGIFVDEVADVTIEDNTLWNIGNDGISVEDAWYNVTISGNYVGAPRMVTDGEETSFIGGGFIGEHGISVEDSDTVSILDNTVFAAGGDGIRATYNDDVTISRNDVFFSSDDGIDVYDAEYADISDNTIVFSGDDGIFAGDVYSSSIEDNLVVLSGYNGISVEGGYETFIEGNFVALSVNNGIVVEGTGNPWYDYEEYYYGYGEGRGPDFTVNILNNKVVLSGYHGIAAYNTGSISVDSNEVALSGTNFTGWIEDIIGGAMSESGFDEEEVETHFFALNWGNGDGIHVENAYRYQYHDDYNDDYDYEDYEDSEYSIFNDESEYESLPAVSITNNNVSWTGGDGIDVSDSSSVFIANNTVDASGIAVTVFDFYEVMEHLSSLNFEQVLSDLDSVVDGEGSLIEFLDYVLPTPVETLRSEGNGIRLDGNESVHLLSNLINNSGAAGLFAEGGYNGDIVLQANTFNNNPVGAWFESGIINLTGEANTFNGGEVGLLFRPTEMRRRHKQIESYDEGEDDYDDDGGYAPLSLVNNTIGTTNFNGQSRYYVELDNGAFFAPGSPTILDGLNATYDGFRPSTVGGILTPEQYDAIEAKIYHYNDLASLGLFFFGAVPGNINDKDIYRAIDGFKPSNGPLNLTIVGLPFVPGYGGSVGSFLNSIAPAAGGDNPPKPKKFSSMIEQLANLEPAAGGNNDDQQGNNNAPQVGDSTCWGDAMAAAAGGTIVNMSYDGSPDMALSNAAACQSGI